MQIQVTHTLTLSDDTKAFLTDLFRNKGASCNTLATATDPITFIADMPITAAPEPERKVVVPNGIAVTRIGQETEAAIMKLLPASIETIETAIKRKRFDAEGLLKLLWTRSKIGYDGEFYHVRG